jgi:hypothetical protein
MLDRHHRRHDLEGQRRNLLGAMMAMPVDAVAVPFVGGHLLLAPGVGCEGSDGSSLRHRLAGDGVHRATEHDAQQQHESCDVRDVPKTEPKKHAGRSLTVEFAFRHPVTFATSRTAIRASIGTSLLQQRFRIAEAPDSRSGP